MAGKDNTIADTISHKKFILALQLIPNFTILSFTCTGGLPTVNYESTVSQQPTWQLWMHKHLVCKCAIALSHAIDHLTKSPYNSSTNSYLAFCHLHHCLVEPTPETLSFLAVFMFHYVNPKSVDNYLSSICNNLESFFPNICTASNSVLVSQTLTGCKQLYSHPSHCKQALTWDDLLIVSDILNSMITNSSSPYYFLASMPSFILENLFGWTTFVTGAITSCHCILLYSFASTPIAFPSF